MWWPQFGKQQHISKLILTVTSDRTIYDFLFSLATNAAFKVKHGSFTGINEAPPHHQLRSRRRHEANKHSQFQKPANKSCTKGGPWSRAIEDINSPASPAPSTQPCSSTVSISLHLCHANRIDSANIKDLICYYHKLNSKFLSLHC